MKLPEAEYYEKQVVPHCTKCRKPTHHVSGTCNLCRQKVRPKPGDSKKPPAGERRCAKCAAEPKVSLIRNYAGYIKKCNFCLICFSKLGNFVKNDGRYDANTVPTRGVSATRAMAYQWFGVKREERERLMGTNPKFRGSKS